MRKIIGIRQRPRILTGVVLGRLVICAAVITIGSLPAMAIGVTAAQASQTDCKSYGYACTPGYDAVNTEGTWAWTHYGGSYALNANGYHNCTLYAAWRLEQNGMADPGNWGNAVDWINHTSHNNTPAVGSIAWWGSEAGGGFGHVAYVDQVNGNQVHVMADNYVGPNANGYTSAGWIPASSVDAFLHPHDLGNPAAPDVVGVRTTSGEALVKDNGLSAQWVDEYGGVTQIAVASDSTNGPLIAVLTSSGEVLAKEGGLSAQWVDEHSGVTHIAVASDPVHGPLIAVVTSSGEVLAKEGGLSAQWVDEYSGASQVAVASDSTNGPLIAIVSHKTVLAKEGGLSARWVTEYTGASHLAVASDPVHGPLIGILTGTTALAKEGSLSAQWVTEYTGASQIAAASDSANGPLLAVVSAKTVLAKEGSLSAQWVTEYTGASHLAVGSDPVHGPLIGILTGTTALAKEGSLSAQWVTEYSGASQVAVAG